MGDCTSRPHIAIVDARSDHAISTSSDTWARVLHRPSPRAARRACDTGIRGSTAPTSPTSTAAAGEVVRVLGPHRRPLGRALFSDQSQIALRMVTRDDRDVDEAFWRARLAAAIAFRDRLGIDASAWRLVHGEGDLLPSLIVDRYADVLVVQTLSQGTERLLPVFARLLMELTGAAGVLERNDPRVRALEGLDQRVSVVAGAVPELVQRARRAGGVRGRPAARAEDRAVPRPAREPRRRRRLRARPAARRLQLPRRVRAGDGRGVLARRGARRLGAGGRRRSGPTPRATACRTSTPARPTPSTSCAGSTSPARASTPWCSTRRPSPRTRRR